MNAGQRSGASIFWRSVLIGAYAGIAVQFVIVSRHEAIEFTELWAIPIVLAIYGAFAVPFVAFGLALFGLPLESWLRPKAPRWWVGLIALLWGGLAGKLMYYVVDHLLFFGTYRLWMPDAPDMGLIYGVPTGIAWWLLHRRDAVRRAGH